VERLAPRLKALSQGSYKRSYRSRGGSFPSSTLQLVADLLDAFGVSHESQVPLKGTRGLVADFRVNGTLVFVDRSFGPLELETLRKRKEKVVVINTQAERSDRLDHGVRILGLGGDAKLQTIFLDDPSFNFDYAHILPKTQKCSVMHGHTSSVLVEVIGHPQDGMVVDFADAKRIVREAVRGLDHKLFINRKYVKAEDHGSVTLSFETVHGMFEIRAPKQTTVMMDGEATVENLAREVLSRITPPMPSNVTAVGVYVYEGMNKGSHVMAQLHDGGAAKRKKSR